MLLDSQIATLMEAVSVTEPAQIEYLLENVTAAQEVRIAADIAAWDAIKDKTTRLVGGSDGVDFDPARTRAAIEARLRIHLRMSAGGSDYGPGYIRLARA